MPGPLEKEGRHYVYLVVEEREICSECLAAGTERGHPGYSILSSYQN